MTTQEAFYTIGIMSALNATILFTLKKWGFFDWVHTYKPRWLMWYPECYFCYGFHLALIETLLILAFVQSWHLVYIPFASTSLTWVLFKKMLS